MMFGIPLKYSWIAMPLFWAVTLCGVHFRLDVSGLNLCFAVLLLWLFNPMKISDKKYLWFGGIVAIIILLTFFISAHYWGVLLFFLAEVICYFLSDKNKTDGIAFLIIALAAFANLSFITNTDIGAVQYDFLSCYNYIEYVMENHLMFWHENPLLTRPSYSTYHPILHYLIAGLAVMTGEAFGATRAAANEALQVLVVGYMLWYYVLCYKILDLLTFKPAVKSVLLAFIVLFPAYNAIAGFINNDCLLLPLQAGAVYYALLYYFNGGKKNLFLIWIFVTLACLTKLSGVLVLPMIGVVLLLRLFNKKKREIFFEQVIFSIAILAGVALWPLYQHYQLHISADFVPPQNHLSLTQFSFWERFNPLNAFIYERMFYDDYGPNLWETLTKTALFGQWNFAVRGEKIMGLISLMVIGYKLINASMIIGVSYLLIKSKDKKLTAIFIALLAGLIGGLIAFSLKHPFMCNQDFRYIAILPLSYALILGQFMEQLPLSFRRVIALLLGSFAVLSCYIWFFVSR